MTTTSNADIFEYQTNRRVTRQTGYGGIDLSAEEGQFTIIYDGLDGSPFRVRKSDVDRYLVKTKREYILQKNGNLKYIGELFPAFVINKEEARIVSGKAKKFAISGKANGHHKKRRRGGKRARRSYDNSRVS